MLESQIDIQIKIGKRLKELRITAGYKSYVAWADEHSIERKQLWKLENGKNDFKLSSLVRIIQIHNLTLEEFFKGL